jgi:thymidylate synthase
VSPTKGKSSEIFGALLQLSNPRARLSLSETRGKAFSTIGELLWYFSGTNDLNFIKYYIPEYCKFSDDGETVYGGYGPRLFNMHGEYNQINQVINILTDKPHSRRAVIQLFDAKDLEKHYKDIPCTCTLQFVIRDELLHLFVSMRSNDAYLGLPHDIFCFTMLQEIIARTLNKEVGQYSHAVGSLHLYEKHKESAENYLAEGFQSSKLRMPDMPVGNPWLSIEKILAIEPKIRENYNQDLSTYELEPYWLDLINLLKIHSLCETNNNEPIDSIKQQMSTTAYNRFIEKRIKAKE